MVSLMGVVSPALTLLVQEFYRGTVFGLGLIVSYKPEYKMRLYFSRIQPHRKVGFAVRHFPPARQGHVSS